MKQDHLSILQSGSAIRGRGQGGESMREIKHNITFGRVGDESLI